MNYFLIYLWWFVLIYLGIRKAQVKLAVSYLMEEGGSKYAEKIYNDMLSEPKDRLLQIWSEMKRSSEAEFWEINDRGDNMNYLTEEQKNELDRFFSKFNGMFYIYNTNFNLHIPIVFLRCHFVCDILHPCLQP